jgi:hypothetical protein
MTYLAAVLSSAISFLLGLYLGRKAHPEPEEYGVQGVDPYVVGLWSERRLDRLNDNIARIADAVEILERRGRS